MDTQALRTRLFYFFLVLLVLTGSALRFQNIDQKSFWADELFTLRMAIYHPLVPDIGQPWYRKTSIHEIRDGDTFLTAKTAEQHPPLQDLLEKASVNALGLSEFSARLPGAVAACLLLAWFAWFASRSNVAWERRALTWALLLLTFSPALVIYAQDARAYSLGTSLIGMGGLLWLSRWQQGWRQMRPPGWGEIVLLLLACYSHYNAAAMVAVLLLPDFLLACKTRNRTPLIRLASLTLAFSVWLALSAHTILATSKGSVAWGLTALQKTFATINGTIAVFHGPWLWLFLVAWLAVVARHFSTQPQVAAPRWAVQIFFLQVLLAIYIALAGWIVATAGMAHPRFYIFAVPLFLVMLGLLLGQIQRTRWAVLAALIALSVTLPTKHRNELQSFEDFRGMTKAALQGSGQDSVFLFPWPANRDMYRLYLDQLSGQDNRGRMVGVAETRDMADLCERLKDVKHIAVLAHDSGRKFISEFYSVCGHRWPSRQLLQFHNTFAEHWRIEQPPPTIKP
ncbi:MAG: hypothetical protein HEQ39_18340 [Rhizobacter sp.]